MPNAVDCIEDSIDKDGNASGHFGNFEPVSVKCPYIEGLGTWVADIQEGMGNAQNNRASTIVLNGVFRQSVAIIAPEGTPVVLAPPPLESPFGSPPIPQCFKNSRLYSRGNRLG